jgi:hypothetical protein
MQIYPLTTALLVAHARLDIATALDVRRVSSDIAAGRGATALEWTRSKEPLPPDEAAAILLARAIRSGVAP